MKNEEILFAELLKIKGVTQEDLDTSKTEVSEVHNAILKAMDIYYNQAIDDLIAADVVVDKDSVDKFKKPV